MFKRVQTDFSTLKAAFLVIKEHQSSEDPQKIKEQLDSLSKDFETKLIPKIEKYKKAASDTNQETKQYGPETVKKILALYDEYVPFKNEFESFKAAINEQVEKIKQKEDEQKQKEEEAERLRKEAEEREAERKRQEEEQRKQEELKKKEEEEAERKRQEEIRKQKEEEEKKLKARDYQKIKQLETFYKKRQEKEIQNAELKVKRIIETTDERQNKIINSHSSADNIPQIEKDEDVEMNGSDSELSYEERMKQKEAIRQEEEQALLKKKEEELEKKRKLEEKLKLLQKKPQNAVKKEEDVKQQKLAEFQQRKEQLLQNMNQEQNQDEDDEDLELQRVLELSRQEYMETMNLQQGDSSTNGSSEVVMERISLSTILTKVDGLKPRAVADKPESSLPNFVDLTNPAQFGDLVSFMPLYPILILFHSSDEASQNAIVSLQHMAENQSEVLCVTINAVLYSVFLYQYSIKSIPLVMKYDHSTHMVLFYYHKTQQEEFQQALTQPLITEAFEQQQSMFPPPSVEHPNIDSEEMAIHFIQDERDFFKIANKVKEELSRITEDIKHSKEEHIKCFDIMNKILHNIIQEPMNNKFQKVSCTSAGFKLIQRFPEGPKILDLAHFQPITINAKEYYAISFERLDLVLLRCIEQTINEYKQKYTKIDTSVMPDVENMANVNNTRVLPEFDLSIIVLLYATSLGIFPDDLREYIEKDEEVILFLNRLMDPTIREVFFDIITNATNPESIIDNPNAMLIMNDPALVQGIFRLSDDDKMTKVVSIFLARMSTLG